MSSTIRAGVLLSLNDQFSAGMRKASGSASAFGTGLTSMLDKVNRATSGVAAKLGGLGLSIGLGYAVNGVIDLEARMERLGTAMNVSTEKMEGLKKKIFETSQAPDIKVDQSAIIDAIDQIGERTGNMKFAEENLRAIGLAIQATGASGADIGGLFAEFDKMGLGAAEAMRSLDSLTRQGKEGAFTLKNLAGLGPRVISAYAATGRSGETALREMGAALQVIMRGTGEAAPAATAFEAVMRNLTDPVKQQGLKKLGVAIRDQAGQFRPITDIMNDIVIKSKGSLETIGTIFDGESMRAFNSSIAEYQRTGAVSSLQKFLALQGDGSTILADSARNANTLKANIQNLQGAFARFADSNLTKPLGDLAEKLNALAEDPEKVQRLFKGIAVGLGTIVAIKGLATVVGAVSQLKGLTAGAGGSAGATLGLTGGGQAVFVTNWPAGFGGLGGATGGKRLMGHASRSLADEIPAAAPALSRGAAALAAAKSAGKFGLIAGGLAAVGGTIATIANKDLSREDKFKGVGESVGAGLGIAGGTALGAAIGTAILPGLGTIGGALVGALGGWLGGQGGRALGGLAARKDEDRRALKAGRELAAQGIALDPAQRRALMDQGLSGEAARGSMLPSAVAQAPRGEVRFLAETRITDDRTMLSVTPLGVTVPGWSANTGRAQEARDTP